MTKHRVLLWILITVLLAAVAIPVQAAAPPKTPAPKVGQKAGSITALLPVARIVRGAGRAAVTTEAKKGDELIWNDLVKTERGGRARITLTDQSILSLGSQADLRIVRHDARSQQTALALGYGRLRAEVTKIARQGGSFELRTPTAVAGVIGTDFGTDASTVGSTTFLCISGVVQVANADPGIGGSVQCAPGMTTTVAAGKAPTIPTGATPEQIQQMIQDTEPALISAMSPLTALPGATVDAVVTGAKMAGIKSVSVSGAGMAASLVGAPTDTSATIHLILDPSAAPGPRTITLSKESGAASAAVFTILSPPTEQAAGGDPKKPYHDLFAQEAGSAKAGLSAFVSGAQQAADQASQQLQQANQGNVVDLTQAVNSLTAEVAKLQKAVDDAGPQIDAAASAAGAAFDSQYETAHNALLQRNPDGTPDDAFNKAVLDVFNQVNAALGSNLNGIRGTVASAAQAATGNVGQIQANWTTAISTAVQKLQPPPTPAVNNIERTIDVGGAFGGGTIAALDASNSKASGGASIVGYNWVLCDSSYKPAQFGVPIAANTSGCNPVSGYASSSSDFSFATCNLNPGDYIARATVTDSNNQSAAMDVKVHVLAPAYDDPSTRFNNLAGAYSSLNITQFLSFFDDTRFAGYNILAENIRKNFPLLANMSVLPQISMSSTSCNDASLSGTWAETLRYKSVAVDVTQRETLTTVHMVRTPGKGWFINDFQGSTGTIPGAPNVDSSAPDLAVTAIYPSYVGEQMSTAVPVPPGNQSFTAVIANKGTANFTSGTVVRFTLLNSSLDVPLPVPLAANTTVSVNALLTVPATVGMPFQVQVNVNPGQVGTPAESDYSNNVAATPTGSESLFVGTPVKLGLLNTSPLAFLSGGPAQTLQVSVSDAAEVTVGLPRGFTLDTSASLPSACTNTSAATTLTFTGAGTACWPMMADYTAQTGSNLTPFMVVAWASGVPVSLNVPYSVTGPVFTQPTPYPMFIAGFTQEMPLLVYVSQPVKGVKLTLPLGFTTSSTNPQDSIVSAGYAARGATTGLDQNVLVWLIKADLTVPATTSATMNLGVGQFNFAAQYSVMGPVISPSTTPALVAGSVTPQPLTVGVSQPGTYTLTLPTGISAAGCTGSTCAQTVTSPGPITWDLTASFAAAAGAFDSTTSTMTVSPGGVYTFKIPYSVIGVANYIISNVVIKDSAGGVHNLPLTGANAFQSGETMNQSITITNQGNADGTGTIVVTGWCTGSAGCSGTGPSSAAVPAPAKGQSITATIVDTQGPSMVPGPYQGGYTLSDGATGNPIPLAAPFSVDFDVVDFAVAMNYADYPPGFIPSDPQNFLVGAPQRVEVRLSETSSIPFSIPLTIGPANPNLNFAPQSASISPGTLAFAATSTTAMPTGPYTVTVTGTNHGVTRTVDQAMNFMTADLQFANLYLNDAGNPLKIQVGNTTPQIVSLTLSATSFIGSISLAPSPNPYFTQNIFGEGSSYEWDITATSAPPTVQAVNAAGQIPNSYPETTIYKPLYVTTIGVPDLQIVSVTPARPINSTNPWLAGEAIDFQVTVQNRGTAGAATAGREQVTMKLGGYEVDNGNVNLPTTPLNPGDSTIVNLHAVAPDVGSGFTSSSNSLKIKVQADPAGDMNYNDNVLQQTVPTANWNIVIPATTGSGSSDGNALAIAVGTQVTTTVQYVVDGGATPYPSVDEVGGATTTGVQISDFDSWSLSSSKLTDTVYVWVPSDATLPTGYGYAQVIAQMKDGGTVTARRQATIHLLNGGAPGFQPISVTISPVNFASSGTPLQLNGPLAQNFTVTPGCGTGCGGSVDLTFNDAVNTTTSPYQFKAAQMGVAQTATVNAAMDAAGQITTGAATGYQVSATGTAIVLGRRGSVSPSPVGPTIPLYVNVGDIDLNPTSAMSAGGCVSVPPGGPSVPLTADWVPSGGFNANISWQLTGTGSPYITSSGNYNGSATYSSGYTPLNGYITASAAVDTLVQYVMEVTISNGTSSATKYFQLYIDASAAQNLCGATLGARGYGSQRIKGTWRRSAIGTGGPVALSGLRTSASASGAKPDLRLSASDVSFLPSVPRLGDAVQVRFRVRNEGDADAVGVPIALQINGATVAMDTFNVGAGRTTLGGLEWNGVLPAGVAPRASFTGRPVLPARGRVDADSGVTAGRRPPIGDDFAEAPPRVTAMLVIDPQHTIQQKTTLEKSAALGHFSLRSRTTGTAIGNGIAPAAASQRILLELAEGACAGLRLATGSVGPCGSADLEINVDENRGLSFNTITGVADLGASFGPETSTARLDPARLGSARYASQAVALAGHSYAVQLSGGGSAVLTVVSVRDPNQLDAKARALFRASAVRVLRQLGGDTAGPTRPGDIAGSRGMKSTVFVELVLQTN